MGCSRVGWGAAGKVTDGWGEEKGCHKLEVDSEMGHG